MAESTDYPPPIAVTLSDDDRLNIMIGLTLEIHAALLELIPGYANSAHLPTMQAFIWKLQGDLMGRDGPDARF